MLRGWLHWRGPEHRIKSALMQGHTALQTRFFTGTGLFLALTTFTILFFEITLTRIFGYIFNYHFTSLAVSLAILGLGLGAYARVKLLRCYDQHRLLFAVHFLNILNLILFYMAMNISHHPVVVIASSLVFFVLGGIAISYYYEVSRAEHANDAYMMDLFGAAGACLAFGTTFSYLELKGVFITLLICAIVLAHVSAIHVRFPVSAWFLWSVLFLFILLQNQWSDPLLHQQTHAEKPLMQSMRAEKGRVVATRWSTVGRADLYESPVFQNVKWIFNDATNSTVLLRNTNEPSRRESRKKLLAYFPYLISRPETALVIGSGAGLEVNLAKLAETPRIDAVEVNPAIIQLVDQWEDFAGPVYEQEGVQLFIEEGRKFIATHKKVYDLIQMSLVLTATAQSGTFALAEGYLYTQEAFQAYMQRLSNQGFLAIIDDSLERTLRHVITTLSVLHENMENIAVLYNPESDETGYRYLLLVSRSPIGSDALKNIERHALRMGFELLWLPGRVCRAPFDELLQHGREAFVAKQSIQLKVPIDDQPFFFNFAKGIRATWRLVWSHVLFSMLVGVFILIMIVRETGFHPSLKLKSSGQAFIFGVGFMFIELALLQKLTLAIGGPIKIMPVLLFAILLFTGVGSYLSKILARRFGFNAAQFSLLAALVNAILVFIIERFYLLSGVSSDILRMGLTVLMVAPIGMAIGMPFPNLLKEYGRLDKEYIAYLWAVNAMSSVLGGALFLVLALQFGIRWLMLAGSACYFMAWIIDEAWWRLGWNKNQYAAVT